MVQNRQLVKGNPFTLFFFVFFFFLGGGGGGGGAFSKSIFSRIIPIQ